MKILRASERSTVTRGSFHIERVKPGDGDGSSTDTAFGPLAVFDHANLGVGTVVKMHEHVNDEILSYMWRGTMLHEDRAGHKIPISSRKLMMMNAGRGFWHEECTPDEAVEMLQIFVRPREADLSPEIAFFDRPDGPKDGQWSLIAGPEGSEAPLTVRNAVSVYDIRLGAGANTHVPKTAGLSPVLYVMDGSITIGDETLDKGDAASDPDGTLSEIKASDATTLVLFLVDIDAPASTAGTISGR